ncbi:MAG: heme-binding domain-containing protein [Armatimonadetes bacterium]|nr:heme-binding domain-containing protein [Armatimonadota bacterium]
MNQKSKAKVGVVVAIILFVIIQLIPVERTNPPVSAEMPAPPHVREILKRSCYDCHSNETVWPWYSRVAPASWLVSRDVTEGRKELNVSEWDRYNERRRAKKMREIWKEVDKGDMPLRIYLPMHPNAKLTEKDKQALHEWVVASGAQEKP